MASYGYLRVSSISQVESGAGLAAQEDACRKSAGSLDAVFTDAGVSGATSLDRRPALLEAIGQLRRGDVIWVAKRDRLGRDPLVVAMIESAVSRKGARIASVAGEGTDDDSPSSVLMRRMIDAFAEYERLIIGARTKSALAAKKARFERVGSVRFGYVLAEDGKHLEVCDREQEIMRLVRMLRDSGSTLRSIAAELTDRGYQPRGSAWHPATIASIAEAANGQAV